MPKDLINNILPVTGLVPAVRTTTTLSSACDRRGYQSVVTDFNVGAFGDSQSGSVYIDAELQESDDNVTYSAVANADLLFRTGSARTSNAVGTFFSSKTTGAADTGSAIYSVGYRGNKRYLKVNVRHTGSHSTGTPYAASFRLGHPDYAPAA